MFRAPYSIFELKNVLVNTVYCHRVHHLKCFLLKLCNTNVTKLLLTFGHTSNLLQNLRGGHEPLNAT
jgi:hypothetical protein